MKTIKIFLASSGELKEEREKIALFIAEKNKKLVKQDVFIELVVWEELLHSFRGERIQDYFNEEMLNCEIVIALFYKKVGQFTKEEFDIAYKGLKDGRNPKHMFVFFKEAKIHMSEFTKDVMAVVKLKNDIEKAEQIYSTFNSNEDLILKLQRQLEHVMPDHQSSSPQTIPLQRPPQAEHFTDREKELAKLLEDLQPGKRVTLCGPGGIGKSALASTAIWKLAPDNKPSTKFPDGIIWHDFYKEPHSIKALENIAISFNEDPRQSPIEAAKRALSGKQTLILLDGTEDADDLPLILNLLGNCCALVTTRKKQDAGAQRYDMQSLPTNEAVKLFQSWSKNSEAKSVQRICELTGGLPLAVRLAGKYIFETGEPVNEYLENLEKSPLETLDQGGRKLESVPILLKRSLNQVSDNAVRILGIAGILSFSPFSKDVIQSSMTDIHIKKPINELISYGLLNRIDKRFIISHALIHTYARKNHSPDNTIVERVAEYYKSYAMEHSAQGPKGYVLLDQDRTHIMRIIEECKTRHIWQWVTEIVGAVENYLNMCGYWTERIIALQSGVEAVQKFEDKNIEGSWLAILGNAYINLGKIEKAIEYNEQALSISREIGERKNESACLSSLGTAFNSLGQIEKAIEYYEKALSISREIGNRNGEGNDLSNLGNAYISLGQTEKAIEYYEQALSISREIGHRQDEGSYLGNLGNAYISLDQTEKAIEYYEQALSISREIGHRQGEGTRLGNLGNSYISLGQVEKAIEYYEQALSISREIGDRQGEVNHLANLGTTNSSLGQIEKAIEYFKQGLSIIREIGHSKKECAFLGSIVNAYSSLGQVEKTIEYYEQALSISREIGDRQGEGGYLGNLSNAYNSLGQIEKAIEYNEQALSISREIGDRKNEGSWLGNRGSFYYYYFGQIEKAIECYEQALSISREIGDRQLEGNNICNLGNVFSSLGQIEKAIKYYQESVKIFEEIRSPKADVVREKLEKLKISH